VVMRSVLLFGACLAILQKQALYKALGVHWLYLICASLYGRVYMQK